MSDGAHASSPPTAAALRGSREPAVRGSSCPAAAEDAATSASAGESGDSAAASERAEAEAGTSRATAAAEHDGRAAAVEEEVRRRARVAEEGPSRMETSSSPSSGRADAGAAATGTAATGTAATGAAATGAAAAAIACSSMERTYAPRWASMGNAPRAEAAATALRGAGFPTRSRRKHEHHQLASSSLARRASSCTPAVPNLRRTVRTPPTMSSAASACTMTSGLSASARANAAHCGKPLSTSDLDARPCRRFAERRKATSSATGMSSGPLGCHARKRVSHASNASGMPAEESAVAAGARADAASVMPGL